MGQAVLLRKKVCRAIMNSKKSTYLYRLHGYFIVVLGPKVFFFFKKLRYSSYSTIKFTFLVHTISWFSPPEYFYHHQKETPYLLSITLHFSLLPAPGNHLSTYLLSRSTYTGNISCKWNHTIYGFSFCFFHSA